MPLARASELDRLLACAGSLVLSREYNKTPRAKEAADWGTYAHYWKETGQIVDDDTGNNRKWARRLKTKLKASGLKRDEFWPPEGRHEVTMALNILTLEVKMPPERQDAKEGQARKAYIEAWKGAWGDDWVTGTLDYVMELAGLPWVDDLKTGRSGHPKDYEWQQTFYCTAWGLHNYGQLMPTRSTISHWPVYPRAAPPTRRGGLLEVGYLNLFVDRLKDLRERVLHAKGGGLLRLYAGDQCSYCPSQGTCPKLIKGENYVRRV